MNLTIVQDAQPTDEPLLISDVEQQLNLDSGTGTANLQQLITAARLEAEKENGRELAKKQFLLVLDRFPCESYWTSFGLTPPQYNDRPYGFYFDGPNIGLLDPLISVDSFTYRTSDGTVNTLNSGTDYIVDTNKHPGEIWPAYGTQWPTATLWPTSAVQIKFTAGFLPAQVPAVIKNGMLLLIGEWYENRLPFTAVRFIAEMPFSVRSAFQNNKLWKF